MSGAVDHLVTSDDPLYEGLVVDGFDYNVSTAMEGLVVINEEAAGDTSLGRTVVREERSGPYSVSADFPTFEAIRTTSQHPLGLWHYTEWATGERELYDSVEDPWELTNLAKDKAYADVLDQLAADLDVEFRGAAQPSS